VNWIARSSQQLDHKLLLLPYRDRFLHFRTRLTTLIAARSACIGLVFLLLLAAWAAYSWVLTIERIVRYYNPLPVWDYWNVVQHLPQYRAFDLRVLWIQHNEHRILFPEIVFAIDMLLLHGRQILPLAISFLCYFSTWLVMSWTILSDRSLSRTTRYSAILLACVVIGWQGSAAVLAVPFLLQWTLTQFASVGALALIIPLNKTSRTFYLAGTVACATIATYSSANGLTLWPVILLACVLLRLRGRYILVIAIAAIINISLYFIGYHFTHQLDLSTLFSHPVYFLGFLSSYMSMPFGRLKPGNLCVWTGFLNLALFFYLLAISVRARLLASAPAIVLFGYFVFTLLTALLTAAGRMNPNDMTFTAAMASRYLNIPLANWGALIIALIWLSGRCGWRLMSPRIILVTATVLLLLILPKFARWLYTNDVFFARQQWATLSVENGLFDPEIARNLHPSPAFIKSLIQRLRDDHLSLFYRGYSGLLGQPLTSRFPQPSTRSRLGGVMRTFPVSGGLEIVGWTDGPRPQRFVFVDESDRIVGLGRKLPAGSPPSFSQEAPSSLAWVGFINLRFQSKLFSTYSFGPHEGRPTPIMDGSSIPAFPREPANPSSSSATHR
jgi:hypothetical protein